MKRSHSLMIILMTLFMFQSLWNVAAAFCGHENLMDVNQQQLNHFGHHQSNLCPQNSYSPERLSLASADCAMPSELTCVDDQISSFDDHHDHLPSFSHFIKVDHFQAAAVLCCAAYVDAYQINWKNLYQSPHLNLLNPPPQSLPLLAG